MEDEFEDENIYEIFKVEITADVETIRKKYRKLSLTCHPDYFPNDRAKAEQFMKLKRACELLCDPGRRKTYDAKQKTKLLHQKRKAESTEESKRFREKLDEKEREYKRKKVEEEEAKMRKSADVVSAYDVAMKKLEEQSQKNKAIPTTSPLDKKTIVIDGDEDSRAETDCSYAKFEKKSYSKESLDALVQSHNDLESQILAQMMGMK